MGELFNGTGLISSLFMLLPFLMISFAILYFFIRTAAAIWRIPSLMRDMNSNLSEIRFEIRKLARSKSDVGNTQESQNQP